MTVGFALDYIPRRMCELGFGEDYLVRFRHLRVEAAETIHINSDNDFYMLIDPNDCTRVESKMGCYDILDLSINEQQHEHRGRIKVTNTGSHTLWVIFIQAIPKYPFKNRKNCQ